MNQDNSDRDDMLPEYDFRGGVRGKYFERYQEGRIIVVRGTLAELPFVAQSTTSVTRVGSITRVASYPPPQPSPKIQIGSPAPPVHAG